MSNPMTDLPRLHKRAQRRAARDHCNPFKGIYDSVTPMPASQCVVVSVRFFDAPYPNTPLDIGEVEVTYAREGYRAIYGFDNNFNLTLYAD